MMQILPHGLLKYWLLLSLAYWPLCILANGDPFVLQSKNITISLSRDGQVTGITMNKSRLHTTVTAFTEIESFISKKDIAFEASDKKSIRFEHALYSDSLQLSCKLVETFSITANSIRWHGVVTGGNRSWSSVIRTVVKYPANAHSRFWTSWGQPQFDSAMADGQLLAEIYPYKNKSNAPGWQDPLIPVPFSKQTYYYGAPPFNYDDIKDGFIPMQGNLFAIPFASVFEKKQDAGFSVFLSPEDDIIDLVMHTDHDGSIRFERLFNRVDGNHKLDFSLDLVAHQSDWRSVLQWFCLRYPAYTLPENPGAAALGGTAAYSNFFDDFNADKMKKMAFTVNWQASFDFPYMGMFLPPVKHGEPWNRLGGGSISIDQMDSYAKRMKQKGFYVLSYFNVTEFGTGFSYPPPAGAIDDSPDLWKDGSRFLYKKFPHALLIVPDKINLANVHNSKTVHGGPYYNNWKDGVSVDCGDPAFQKFLLDQARRIITETPDVFGICIDRLDWLRFFNEHADDQKTWFHDQPARALVNSWKDLMSKLGPMMHQAGKSVFVNNHYKRIDLLKHVDGILDEFTNATTPLNTTAFLTLSKPALGWTPGKEVIEAEGGDHFFQKYLYLGVFPMCPFPGNDHALTPGSAVDQLYLDYGPLMNQLKEKRWVLKPGITRVINDKAKVNIFKTKSGYTIPVVYATGDTVTVVLHNAEFVTSHFMYRAYLPGRADPILLKTKRNRNDIEIQVPLVRGAAMITISK